MTTCFKKEYRNAFFPLLIIFFVSITVGAFLVLEIKKSTIEIENNLLAQISAVSDLYSKDQRITLMLVGDIMLDRGVEYSIKKEGKENFEFPFLKITDDLKEADVLFGNLEGPISDKGIKVGSIYSFRSDPKAIKGLRLAGFDILSVANNHIFDYGREAMEDTFKRLKDAKIDYIGGGLSAKEAHSAVIKDIKNTKIAFLAYDNIGSKSWSASENNSGISWLEEEEMIRDIKTAREKADLVIVSVHFGDEYQTQPNLNQKYFSHLAIDSGADLVVGHHPHVVQTIEEYKNGYIFYSLGNFVFDQKFSEETMTSLLIKVLIKDKKIIEAIPIKIKINEFFQPEITN